MVIILDKYFHFLGFLRCIFFLFFCNEVLICINFCLWGYRFVTTMEIERMVSRWLFGTSLQQVFLREFEFVVARVYPVILAKNVRFVVKTTIFLTTMLHGYLFVLLFNWVEFGLELSRDILDRFIYLCHFMYDSWWRLFWAWLDDVLEVVCELRWRVL